jgi:hypothetical protein
MSPWNELTRWMYGDARQEQGFWYAHPLEEIHGLTEEQLLWVPNEQCLCRTDCDHQGGAVNGAVSFYTPKHALNTCRLCYD